MLEVLRWLVRPLNSYEKRLLAERLCSSSPSKGSKFSLLGGFLWVLQYFEKKLYILSPAGDGKLPNNWSVFRYLTINLLNPSFW